MLYAITLSELDKLLEPWSFSAGATVAGGDARREVADGNGGTLVAQELSPNVCAVLIAGAGQMGQALAKELRGREVRLSPADASRWYPGWSPFIMAHWAQLQSLDPDWPKSEAARLAAAAQFETPEAGGLLQAGAKSARRGPKPTEPSKKLKLVLGWLEAEASGVTQSEYCERKGISTARLRVFLDEFRAGKLRSN